MSHQSRIRSHPRRPGSSGHKQPVNSLADDFHEELQAGLEDIKSSLSQEIKDRIDRGFEKVEQKVIELDGKDALRYEYTFTSERDEKVREQIIIVLADDKVFHIASWADDKNFASVSAEIDAIVASTARHSDVVPHLGEQQLEEALELSAF